MGALESGERLLVVGALVAGGAFAIKSWDSIPECIRKGDVTACIGAANKPATAKLGGIAVASEEVTGTAAMETFGEVTMDLKGYGTFDYDKSWLRGGWPGVDATYYFNRDNKSTAKVTYNPCIQLSGDYAKKTLDMPYSISPAANGTVSIKTTSTGAIDTCFTRFDSKNERLWSSNNHNQLAFGDKQANTFRWMVAEVETAYAEQAACPEKTVDMPAVDDSIAGFILGDISKNHPEYNQVAHNAYVKGKAAGFAVGSAFEIDLESPEARRAAAAGRFDKK